MSACVTRRAESIDARDVARRAHAPVVARRAIATGAFARVRAVERAQATDASACDARARERLMRKKALMKAKPQTHVLETFETHELEHTVASARCKSAPLERAPRSRSPLDVDDATAHSGTGGVSSHVRAVHRRPSRAVRVQEARVDAWNIQGVVGGGFRFLK